MRWIGFTQILLEGQWENLSSKGKAVNAKKSKTKEISLKIRIKLHMISFKHIKTLKYVHVLLLLPALIKIISFEVTALFKISPF